MNEKKIKRITPQTFALALLMATSFQIMENLLPRIPLFPWMRLGLSYVIILPFLIHFGALPAFLLLLARNLISVLYGGQPFSTFLISSSAGAITFLGIGFVVQKLVQKKGLGMMGASILLAAVFNMAQLALVKWILIQHTGFYFFMGPMLAWSLFSGILVAMIIHYSKNELAELLEISELAPLQNTLDQPADPVFQNPQSEMNHSLSEKNSTRIFWFGLLGLVGLFIGSHLYIQLTALSILLLISKDKGKLLLAAWPFFIYLAWLHLFNTPGQYLYKDWITVEGLNHFSLNALRLANTILLGRLLSKHFPWKWAEGSKSPYLQGFLLSLPLLPEIFSLSLEFGREMFRRLRRGEREGFLSHAFEAWRIKLENVEARKL